MKNLIQAESTSRTINWFIRVANILVVLFAVYLASSAFLAPKAYTIEMTYPKAEINVCMGAPFVLGTTTTVKRTPATTIRTATWFYADGNRTGRPTTFTEATIFNWDTQVKGVIKNETFVIAPKETIGHQKLLPGHYRYIVNYTALGGNNRDITSLSVPVILRSCS